MEYEVRFYYPKSEYNNLLSNLSKINNLKNNGRKYEKTSQFNHPSPEYNYYSKEIDGRFRVRITTNEKNSECKISWKRRLASTTETNINKEEEVEIRIDSKDYDNLVFIIKEVIHMTEVQSYERYRTTFINDEIEIALDEYPFGLALEIESKTSDKQEEVINKYVKLLNLDYKDSYRLSWDDKYEELCKEQNVEKYNHVLFGKEMPEIK